MSDTLKAVKSRDSLLQDYMDQVALNLVEKRTASAANPLLQATTPARKRMRKEKKPPTSAEESVVLKPEQCDQLLTADFNASALKSMAKHYRLKCSGNKQELVNRLYRHLLLSRYAIHLQRVFRGHVVRRYVRLHGPPRAVCALNNDTDFVTMEPLVELSWHRLIRVQDTQRPEFVYGFDVASLLEAGKEPSFTNPYNRQPFPATFLSGLRSLVRLVALLGFSEVVQQEPDKCLDTLSEEKKMELRAVQLFQRINELGHYSNFGWFWHLPQRGYFRFYCKLRDVWETRAQISLQTKREIVPPQGNPFHDIPRRGVHQETFTEAEWRGKLLHVMEQLVTKGINKDSQVLGSYYVLGGLTMVCMEAALALPWLHQSFA